MVNAVLDALGHDTDGIALEEWTTVARAELETFATSERTWAMAPEKARARVLAATLEVQSMAKKGTPEAQTVTLVREWIGSGRTIEEDSAYHAACLVIGAEEECSELAGLVQRTPRDTGNRTMLGECASARLGIRRTGESVPGVLLVEKMIAGKEEVGSVALSLCRRAAVHSRCHYTLAQMAQAWHRQLIGARETASKETRRVLATETTMLAGHAGRTQDAMRAADEIGDIGKRIDLKAWVASHSANTESGPGALDEVSREIENARAALDNGSWEDLLDKLVTVELEHDEVPWTALRKAIREPEREAIAAPKETGTTHSLKGAVNLMRIASVWARKQKSRACSGQEAFENAMNDIIAGAVHRVHEAKVLIEQLDSDAVQTVENLMYRMTRLIEIMDDVEPELAARLAETVRTGLASERIELYGPRCHGARRTRAKLVHACAATRGAPAAAWDASMHERLEQMSENGLIRACSVDGLDARAPGQAMAEALSRLRKARTEDVQNIEEMRLGLAEALTSTGNREAAAMLVKGCRSLEYNLSDVLALTRIEAPVQDTGEETRETLRDLVQIVELVGSEVADLGVEASEELATLLRSTMPRANGLLARAMD